MVGLCFASGLAPIAGNYGWWAGGVEAAEGVPHDGVDEDVVGQDHQAVEAEVHQSQAGAVLAHEVRLVAGVGYDLYSAALPGVLLGLFAVAVLYKTLGNAVPEIKATLGGSHPGLGTMTPRKKGHMFRKLIPQKENPVVRK